MKKTLNLILSILILGAIIYGIWWKLGQNKIKMAQESDLSLVLNQAIPVTVATAGNTSFDHSFTVNGTFQPSQQMMMISDVAGKVTQLNIQDGSFVQAGKVLLSVDKEYLENELEAAEINLAKGEKDLARMENLLGEGGVTQAQYEEAKVAVESGKVKLKSLIKRIGDTDIKAPITGYISKKRVEMGSVLGPGAPIAMIVNISPIVLITFLTEEQVISIKKGQLAQITVDVYPDLLLQGRVTFIDVQSDNLKRFMIKVEMTNPSSTPIKAGMSGKVSFAPNGPIEVLSIPRSAFVGSLLDGKVYLIENDKAILRKVKTGESFEGQVEVLEGLKAGDQVVISGKINLKDNTTVEVIKQ